MRKLIPFSFLIVSALLLLATVNCHAQYQTLIGVHLTGERTAYAKNTVGWGVTFEKQFTRHSGLEVGSYYRVYPTETRIYVDGSLFGMYITKEQFLSVPVLYKFYTSFINVSVGPTFDTYLGWKPGRNTLPFRNDMYQATQRFQMGWLGKISKSILLSKHLLAEPELRYNRVFSHRKYYYGAGLAVKYLL